MTKVWIDQISHFIPDNEFSNEKLISCKNIRMKPKIIERITGVKTRFFADEDSAASDLAVESIRKIIPLDFEGPIFVSTISPDFMTPSTGSIIKGKLGLKDSLPCFDLNAACAGLLFGLDLAEKYLYSGGWNQAILVASELRSRYLNFSDRQTAFLFADGASSILLRSGGKVKHSLNWIVTKTIASEKFEIYIKSGGSRFPVDSESVENSDHKIKMLDGKKIVEQTTSVMVEGVKTLLNEKKETVSDYDYFIFHQGNENLLRSICQNLDIPTDKTHLNFSKYGNTSSASIGIALSEAVALGKVKGGMRVLLVAMGAGYHFAMASVTWGES